MGDQHECTCYRRVFDLVPSGGGQTETVDPEPRESRNHRILETKTMMILCDRENDGRSRRRSIGRKRGKGDNALNSSR